MKLSAFILLLALLVPGGLLWWVVLPLGQRLNTVSHTLDHLFDDRLGNLAVRNAGVVLG